MNCRIYVEKKDNFLVETKSILDDLNLNLNLNLSSLRYLNVYDVFNIEESLLEKSKYLVFGEVQTDNVYLDLDLSPYKVLAIEYLPGQFDQRAEAAKSCLMLIDPKSLVNVKSSRLYLFNKDLDDNDLNKIKNYLINKVEAREKDLNVLSDSINTTIKEVKVLDGFRKLTNLKEFISNYGLAMSEDDLKTVIDYFEDVRRDPTETELRILDTYWSDHCRHTTFNTLFTKVSFLDSPLKAELMNAYNLYLNLRKETNRENKPLCLMDLAVIGASALRKAGYLDDLEISEENNACSIYVDVEENGKKEKWLLQFKNETHNHPTEIEPFGGASTCLGGAIRDPLSGRSYVYQAMRVTGAANIYEEVKNTLPNKLPQRVISQKAAAGYSSYGNQIGLATTHVKEIYDEDYVAKRLEVGAVVGAVKAKNVRRESPQPGDVILLLGGLTGRDGIGGATGSSKEHNDKSITECASEVQKGNALEERKLERLFRREDVCKLIKKSNDFGAGGVSVAIGELADGLDINLDVIKVKYLGLNATELAISESQERMAVVIDKKDEALFKKLCEEENILSTKVAVVTDKNRLVMRYNGQVVVDIDRNFLNSNGALHKTEVIVDSNTNKFPTICMQSSISEMVLEVLQLPNVTSQKGLIEMFDSTIGRSTVLLPFGGKTYRTESLVSCELLPVLTNTLDASMMAFGYNPLISKYNPYVGAIYAVVEAISKIVAAGGDYKKIRFSFQEYFKRMQSAKDYGLPLMALLGALKCQMDFKLPAIGGKDSMSGTYKDLNVPPMLMAFGVTMVKANHVISPEFKEDGNYVYLFLNKEDDKHILDTKYLMEIYDYIHEHVINNDIISAHPLLNGGIIEALAKMSFGNNIGCDVSVDKALLNKFLYGSLIVESKTKLDNGILIGKTIKDNLIINQNSFNINDLYEVNRKPFINIYKDEVNSNSPLVDYKPYKTNNEFKGKNQKEVKVLIPVFPGTNCDYDTKRAFEAEGATVNFFVFNNLSSENILNSIKNLALEIEKCDILAFAGGFSAGDEPDGSGKFIYNVINNEVVKKAINKHLEKKNLIIGICNGFQALVKSGLLPYSKLGMVEKNSPTLFKNDINRHASRIVKTKVMSNNSPWLAGLNLGEVHEIAISHGEGKFVVREAMFKDFLNKGMIAFSYVDDDGNVTVDGKYNPNGSYYGIEGIVSEDGLILGKMGHTERYTEGCFKNIYGNKVEPIFRNGVNYFRK